MGRALGVWGLRGWDEMELLHRHDIAELATRAELIDCLLVSTIKRLVPTLLIIFSTLKQGIVGGIDMTRRSQQSQQMYLYRSLQML